MCFAMLLYRRFVSVSPVPDKVTQMEVLPAALAENKGECYWTDRPNSRHQGVT